MTEPVRLRTLPGPEEHSVRFQAVFPAPTEEIPEPCAPARLNPGDGQVLDLGFLCVPTPTTWRERHTVDLATHQYPDAEPRTVRFRWGETEITSTVTPGAPAPEAPALAEPEVTLFAVKPRKENPTQAEVKVSVTGLTAEQRLRVDGGAGQVHWLNGADGADQEAVWTLSYSKPGTYKVAIDLVDAEGFWLVTLAESPLEITPQVEEPPTLREREPEELEERPPEPPPSPYRAPAEVPRVAEEKPWLPFRYARPLWAGAKTYTTPGGTHVSRSLIPGTYLSIHAETAVDGALWYQTAGGDWIAASAVDIIKPSELRGVELGQPVEEPTPPPPPPPPPPPEEVRHGVVTAYVLNVRARPGVRPDNPPIDKLRQGTEVTIYEEAPYNGEIWYRIGTGRWVHSGWVRLVEPPEPSEPGEVRRGVVTAYVLNVRARPGVRPDNPPIDKLRQGTEVTIYEEAPYNGEIWYRIGTGRWVHSGWVRLLEGNPRGVAVPGTVARATLDLPGPLTLPVGWVVAQALNVRAQPGVRSDNPPIDQVYHNQPLKIYEEQVVNGERWYRIGENRWVYAGWVAVARYKPRPYAIGPTEHWVGVNLQEQTVVAYEGDEPVYAAMVATGLPGTPTVQGIFRTWWRLRWRRMVGGTPGTWDYYYLEDVTWTCYFYSGYALHAAYWHDAFGRPRSHGCVNMSPYDAWWVFNWSEPGGANSPAVYVYWS